MHLYYLFVERLAFRGIIGGYACGGPGEPYVPPLNSPHFRPCSNVARGRASKIIANTFFPASQTPTPAKKYRQVPTRASVKRRAIPYVNGPPSYIGSESECLHLKAMLRHLSSKISSHLCFCKGRLGSPGSTVVYSLVLGKTRCCWEIAKTGDKSQLIAHIHAQATLPCADLVRGPQPL